MIRLFVALDFPIDVRERLAGLGGGVPGARWTDAENLHLTLSFIGEVPEDRAADLSVELAAVRGAPFDLTLDGVGSFGSGRGARVLWAGVSPSEALSQLQGRIESAITRLGLPVDGRRFTPHVTLARLSRAPTERVGRFLAERGLFRAGPFPIDHFTLYQSLRGKEAAVYRPLRVYPLSA